MRTARRALAVAVVVAGFLAVLAPPVHAEDTVLFYSIKQARAFLEHLAYPQKTFMTEFYAPCNADDPLTYNCDRGRYADEPNCPADVALGTEGVAPEDLKPEELAGAAVGEPEGPEAIGEDVADQVKGNPVTVEHGLSLGHLASTPESGGLASMYYVDNSGRRETLAHAESDGYVGNRHTYEERCGQVDGIFEGGLINDGDNYPLLNAHVLSRSNQGPSTYNLAAFTTPENPDAVPPGGNKESVSIVSLFEKDGRITGQLSSTVRGLSAMDGMLTADLVRTVVEFSSDGTEAGLKVAAKTEALGVAMNGKPVGALPQGTAQIGTVAGDDYQIGVLKPVVKITDSGRQLRIWAGGLYVTSATKQFNDICIPEQVFNADPFQSLCLDREPLNLDPLNGENPFPFPPDVKEGITVGGKLFAEQAVYVAGAIVSASFGRVPAFTFNPNPFTPPAPFLIPPAIVSIPGPVLSAPPSIPAHIPVAETYFRIREIPGSPWPLASIIVATLFGLAAVAGRWSLRFAWAQRLSRYPPFPAAGWAYRAFLKD